MMVKWGLWLQIKQLVDVDDEVWVDDNKVWVDDNKVWVDDNKVWVWW